MTGSVATCYECARGTLEQIVRDECCETCDQELPSSGTCGNPLCNRTEGQRGWKWVWAIGHRRGELETAINKYKFQHKTGWAYIFARVLVGYLEALGDSMHDYDAIIPMPAYVGPDAERDFDHIRLIVERAKIEGPEWPFQLDLMTKTKPTPRLSQAGSFSNRAHVAETQIGPALEVLRPELVAGQRILVFDDVFTGGLTLREVARKLNDAGATEVAGIVLARQPFGG